MRGFDVFVDLGLYQLLSKQWRRRWFKTPWSSLWHHCNAATLRWVAPEIHRQAYVVMMVADRLVPNKIRASAITMLTGLWLWGHMITTNSLTIFKWVLEVANLWFLCCWRIRYLARITPIKGQQREKNVAILPHCTAFFRRMIEDDIAWETKAPHTSLDTDRRYTLTDGILAYLYIYIRSRK